MRLGCRVVTLVHRLSHSMSCSTSLLDAAFRLLFNVVALCRVPSLVQRCCSIPRSVSSSTQLDALMLTAMTAASTGNQLVAYTTHIANTVYLIHNVCTFI
ncbi:hypothetical protein AVEN_64322-1 [Araneus ventricosus]|uniref:Uncharacterized protein n=1 Tax=Araneus ventricosus TaxID=182803 RepID=A0A4Y2V1X1_ARAVE|nr:hypothetical protein AVEN_179136-1 [Araneus ventricosus]GBO17880.1 hypothetical protein AVEN_64322-1 [Araneus ventricosus]